MKSSRPNTVGANERVSVNVVTFRGDDFRDEVEATDSDVELLYDEESLKYEVPERRQLRFLLIDERRHLRLDHTHGCRGPGLLRRQFLAVLETRSGAGEPHSASYRRPGRSRGSKREPLSSPPRRVPVPTSQSSRGPTRTMREPRCKVAILVCFARGRMVPEVRGRGIRARGRCQSLTQVRSAFGFHVITVTEKQEAATQPLTEVRDLIERTLKQEQAATRSSALANAIAEEVSTPADLDYRGRVTRLRGSGVWVCLPGQSRSSDWGWPQQISARAFQLPEGEVAGPIRSAAGTNVGHRGRSTGSLCAATR